MRSPIVSLVRTSMQSPILSKVDAKTHAQSASPIASTICSKISAQSACPIVSTTRSKIRAQSACPIVSTARSKINAQGAIPISANSTTRVRTANTLSSIMIRSSQVSRHVRKTSQGRTRWGLKTIGPVFNGSKRIPTRHLFQRVL